MPLRWLKPALILLFSCLMLIPNLGNCYLWQDEAQTALVSKTILTSGVPMGYDGKNHFSQEGMLEYGKDHIYKWHAWFPFYLEALFFSLFGINTFVARLPFALFGAATILLMYFFSESLFPGKQTGGIASLVLMGSVPFLLLSRQCRYYSIAVFFSMLALYGYKRFCDEKKYGGFVFFASCALLLQTLHIYAVAVFLTVIAHAAFFHKDKLKRTSFLFAGAFALNLPWIVYAWPVLRKAHRHGLLTLSHLISFSLDYIKQLWRYGFTPAMLGIVLLASTYFILRKIWGASVLKAISLPLIFIFINVLLLACTTWISFFRYLAPVIPACLLLVIAVISSCYEIRAWIGALCLLVFWASNPIKDYLYEITHNYDGPIKGIAAYLNKEAKPTDIIAITYGDLPVKFYTGLRVLGGMTREDLKGAETADWIIMRKHIICGVDGDVKEFLNKNVNWVDYERIEIPYPDLPWENRENPPEHHYRTVTDEEHVVIYKRKNPTPNMAKP